MLELAQQISYYLSVVDGGATSKLVGYGQSLASVGMIAMTAKASVESMIAPLTAVANAWSGREQQINSISRSLRQFQFVGQGVIEINKEIDRSMPGASAAEHGAEFTRRYQEQFNDARRYSRGIVSEMNRMAAVLPGEMNDYMQSFSQNMPHLANATGMTVGRAAHLTSYLTAGGVAAGIDAGQSARDLMQALTTGAHIVDRSWTEVWSQYARVKGPGGQMRHLDTAGFNRMRLDDKVRVLEDIAEQLRPMMDATGDSYDALIGTFDSFRHELYLAATEPLFDAWKSVLDAANKQLAQFVSLIATVGKFFADQLAPNINFLAKTIAGAGQHAEAFGSKLSDLGIRMHQAFRFLTINGGAALHGVGAVAGGVYRHVRNGLAAHEIGAGNLAVGIGPLLIGRLLGVAFGPVGMIVGGLLTRLFLNGGLSDTIASLGRVFYTVLPPLWGLILVVYRLYDALMNAASTIVGILLPPIITLAGVLLQTLIPIVMFVVQIVAQGFAMVAMGALLLLPALQGLALILELVMMGWQNILGLFGVMGTESFDFIDALRQMSDAVADTTRSLREDWAYLMHELGVITDEEYAVRMARVQIPSPELPQWMADLRASIEAMRTNGVDLNRPGTPADPPRPHTSQDFRYSRFEITQKFAEGFDPDRVASAFASDLSAMAEQRLDSGFALAFA